MGIYRAEIFGTLLVAAARDRGEEEDEGRHSREGTGSSRTAVETAASTPKSEPYVEVAEMRSEFDNGCGVG